MIAMKLGETRLGFELRPEQLTVLRMIIKHNSSLILGAPTNFGKSLCILLSAFCSSLNVAGWRNRSVLCVVPNVVVLLSIIRCILLFSWA